MRTCSVARWWREGMRTPHRGTEASPDPPTPSVLPFVPSPLNLTGSVAAVHRQDLQVAWARCVSRDAVAIPRVSLCHRV